MIPDAEKSLFKVLWTRQQVEERSVIDYIITNKENNDTVKSVIIDEEKDFGILRVQGKKEECIHKIMQY